MNNSRQLNLILKLKDEVSGGLDKVNSKMQSMQPTFQKMAAIGTASFLAIGAGILKTTQDAAKAEGSWNKFYTVFGEGAEDMTEFINEIRKEMPSATHEIARMSADLQDLLIPMGLSRTASMGMTKEMVILANKLAAFNDVDPTEVLDAFKSGLSGSSEPLRRFGINALDSTLEAHALEKGIGGLKDGFLELSPLVLAQVKAQSLISLAYEQSGDAIAGFEANNDSLIRRQQALQATIKEISVTIGNIFLPIIDDLVKKIAPIIEKLGLWVEQNPKLAKNIILVSLAVSGLVAGIGIVGLILPGIIALVGMLTISMLPLILVIIGFIAVLGVLAVYWVKHFDDIKDGMDGFMEEWNGFFDKVVAKQAESNSVLGMTWEQYFKNVRGGMLLMWEGLLEIMTLGVNTYINLIEGLINSVVFMIDNVLNRINRVGQRIASFLGKDFKKIDLIGKIELPRITQEVFLKRAKEEELGFIGPMNQSTSVSGLESINRNTLDVGGSTIPLARMSSDRGNVNINIQQMIGEEEYAEKMGDKIIQSLKQNQLMTSI